MKLMLLAYTCNSVQYLSMATKKEKAQRDQDSQVEKNTLILKYCQLKKKEYNEMKTKFL